MDPSADIAAWTAVAVAALSILLSWRLYVASQKSAREERIHTYNVNTLIRLLEIMSSQQVEVPNNSLPDALMQSLLLTMTLKVLARILLLQGVFTKPNVRQALYEQQGPIRAELQYAIAATLRD